MPHALAPAPALVHRLKWVPKAKRLNASKSEAALDWVSAVINSSYNGSLTNPNITLTHALKNQDFEVKLNRTDLIEALEGGLL